MIIEFPEHELMLEEQCDGIRIRQHGKTYLARKWQLNGHVVDVLRVGIANGLCCLWQEGHPGGASSHHISFSRSHAPASWVFCIGGGNGAPDVRSITVSKKYEAFARTPEIGGAQGSGGGKNYLIEPVRLSAFLSLASTQWQPTARL